jgi:hypothetical protein
MDETQVMTRRARPDEYVAVGELRVTAYQALGLLPEGSGYTRTLREFGFDGDCVVLVATDEAGNGILGTITLEPFGPASVRGRPARAGTRRRKEAAARRDRVRAGARGTPTTALHAAGHAGRAASLRDDRILKDPDLDFQPVPGLTLRAYELALPRIRG